MFVSAVALEIMLGLERLLCSDDKLIAWALLYARLSAWDTACPRREVAIIFFSFSHAVTNSLGHLHDPRQVVAWRWCYLDRYPNTIEICPWSPVATIIHQLEFVVLSQDGGRQINSHLNNGHLMALTNEQQVCKRWVWRLGESRQRSH